MFGLSWHWVGHSVVFLAVGGGLSVPGIALFWHWKGKRVWGTSGFVGGLLLTTTLIDLLVSKPAFLRVASWTIRHRLLTGGIIGVAAAGFATVFALADVEHWTQVVRFDGRFLAGVLGVVGGVGMAVVLLVGSTWVRRYEHPVGVDATVPPITVPIGSYVALGDSYSAGEGLSPYLAGAQDPPAGDDCHRSQEAYSQQLIFAKSPVPVRAFRACSGAVSGDVFDFAQNAKLGKQVTPGLLNADTNLVTLTMGGNDMHFSDVLEFCGETPHCLSPHAIFNPGKPSADEIGLAPAQPLEQWANAMLKVLGTRLDTLFSRLRHDAPNARIVVIGYPKLLPTGDVPRQFDSCDVVLAAFDRGEREQLSDLEAQMNGTIFQATKSAQVEFIDPTTAFASHEACGVDGELINDLKITGNNGSYVIGVDRGAFHPTQDGQLVLARQLACYLDEYPTAPSTAHEPDAPGTVANPIDCP